LPLAIRSNVGSPFTMPTPAPILPLDHDPEKWEPGFPKRSCSNKEMRT
jgi:hypothetical protein